MHKYALLIYCRSIGSRPWFSTKKNARQAHRNGLPGIHLFMRFDDQIAVRIFAFRMRIDIEAP